MKLASRLLFIMTLLAMGYGGSLLAKHKSEPANPFQAPPIHFPNPWGENEAMQHTAKQWSHRHLEVSKEYHRHYAATHRKHPLH